MSTPTIKIIIWPDGAWSEDSEDQYKTDEYVHIYVPWNATDEEIDAAVADA